MQATLTKDEGVVAQLLAECITQGLTVSELDGGNAAEYRSKVENEIGSGPVSEAVWRSVFGQLLAAMARAVRGSNGPRARVPVCKSCSQPVRWVTTEAGKRLALDPLPHPRGNVTRAPGTRRDVARVHPTCDLPIPGGAAYRPHWSTCPSAHQHRGKVTRLVHKCQGCGQPLHQVLVERGVRRHPNDVCDPNGEVVL